MTVLQWRIFAMNRIFKPNHVTFLMTPAIAICFFCGCHVKDAASAPSETTSYISEISTESSSTDLNIDEKLPLAGHISTNDVNEPQNTSASSAEKETVMSSIPDTAASTITAYTTPYTDNNPAGGVTEATGADIKATDADTEAASAAPSSEAPIPSVQKEGYITGMNVKVRSTPDTEGDNILASLDRGDTIGCVSDTDGWTLIIFEGHAAYVSSKYVSYEPITAETEPSSYEPVSSDSKPSSYEHDYGDGDQIPLESSWTYADYSVIRSGHAVLYRADGNRKGHIVCVNAGHGTSGVNGQKTFCHPDKTPKVTGGTTGEGAVKAIAVSSGMEFNDGTPESKVTLAMAKVLKAKLLDAGYDVLMIRESNDVQLDNVARTVIANNVADCHIAIHWDSTSNDKGAFYMSVPSDRSYRSMEPVASNWQKHEHLGESLISGLRNAGVKIFSGGSIDMDLTQTSYSTIPSVDIELGDAASSHSDSTLDQLGDGLLSGVNIFFGE